MTIPELQLNTGASIPQLGYGLWRIQDEDECKNAVKAALETGYTHFDDAQIYGNEQHLGDVLHESNVDRSRLFITTKIWTDNMASDSVVPSFEQSLQKLQIEYVDLLLLHFPVTETRDEAWQRLQEIHARGQAKAIGVSNYTIDHLEQMRSYDVQPAVNQVEMSVVLQQPELTQYCKKNGIVVQAYTPLAEGHFFEDPTLVEIAKKYNKTVPQIMLRWGIEYGVVVLTKSANPARIKENIDIFDFSLEESDVQRLKGLDQAHRTNWDPTNIP